MSTCFIFVNGLLSFLRTASLSKVRTSSSADLRLRVQIPFEDVPIQTLVLFPFNFESRPSNPFLQVPGFLDHSVLPLQCNLEVCRWQGILPSFVCMKCCSYCRLLRNGHSTLSSRMSQHTEYFQRAIYNYITTSIMTARNFFPGIASSRGFSVPTPRCIALHT